jgi:hypothetical protein
MPVVEVWLNEKDMEHLEELRQILAKQMNPDHVEESDMDEYIGEGRIPGISVQS